MRTIFATRILVALAFCISIYGCIGDFEPIEPPTNTGGNNGGEVNTDPVEGVDYFLPNIDLTHWKVTLPIGNPTEVKPPAILDYGTNELLQDYMYNDSIDGSLVFYTVPGSSTANSSYSRTELRELKDPNGTINWKFAEGGIMEGELKMDEISKENDGDFHRSIIMQIHGRLSDAQRDLIGQDDNNGPAFLKIYWRDNKVRVLRKYLIDPNADDIEILHNDAWDDEGEWFNEVVGFDKFKLKIIASEGRLEIILNDNESMLFEDEDLQRWGIFQQYFKAGNYLITTDADAFARVKYYSLSVSH